MTEATITVSNGEDFFRIPLSDLPDAAADGFYVPGLKGRTIVSDGSELFEIPLEDLPEAEADGFRDTLKSERCLLETAKQMLMETAGVTFGGPDAESALDEPAAEHPLSVAQPMSQETQSQHSGGTLAVTLEPPSAPRSTRPQADQNNEVPGQNKRGQRRAAKSSDPAFEATHEPGDAAAAEEESEGDGISKYLLPGGHLTGGPTWQVMLINTALHGLILFILAAIILPAPEQELLMEITSSFEPKDPVKMEFESVELEQPEELDTDPVEVQVENVVQVEEESKVDIDVSDMPLNVPDTFMETEAATGPASTSDSGELSGRSEAGRAAAVARRGGNAASEAAVKAGLMWLMHHQGKDGGWSFDHTSGECNGRCSQPGSLNNDCRNAATGLALLAMLGAGNTPFNGDFKDSVLRGTRFLLQNARPVPAGLDLRAKHANNTGMYTQAIAATALCEVLSMVQYNQELAKHDKSLRAGNRDRSALIRQLRPAAQAGINFIVNAQHKPSGGWGYDPGKSGDTSILGWQIMALKSAVHAKIAVPAQTVALANKFLTSVQTPDGYFGYRKPEKKLSTTAIGIIARMLSGMKREHPLLKMGVAHLSAHGVEKGNMYYNYYATQVMLHYGGKEWQKWNAEMRDYLVNTQVKQGHAAGSWNVADRHGGRAGRLYMTCLCTMTLEVYYRHLPLYGEPDVVEADINMDKKKQ